MHNSVTATMGIFLLLTLILQILRGHLTSAYIIHEDEHGNPVINLNGSTLEDIFSEYDYGNSTILYEYLDYLLYEIATTKATPIEGHGFNVTNSATALLPFYLSFFIFLHLLFFLLQGSSMRLSKDLNCQLRMQDLK